jgi:acid stress chaperone HdeA
MNATLSRTGLGVAAVALLLAGCTDIHRALNQGGDTPCNEYVKQDQDTKRMTVTKFIKQQTQDDHEPAGTVVDGTMVSVDLLCGAQINRETPIKKADVAGIFIAK